MQNNPWTTKFAFIWYNNDEIYHFSDADFDAKARQLHENGVECVITFTATHFRWSFLPYWEEINTALKKISEACHRYGITVVEHHSSALYFSLHNEDDWAYFYRILDMQGLVVEECKGLEHFVTTDPVICDGVTLSQCSQISGKTGTLARSNYHGNTICYNNPHFRKAYFAYLETIYATGVDGIMTDDIQYYPNACACEHCRKLFKESYGYDLPDPEHWDAFYENYDDPAYVAWKRFRLDSTEQFQRDVNAHFESLGLKLLRPNYISAILYSNWSAYPFEGVADLWDYIFQENCESNIIGPSHLFFMGEANHRYAMGRANGRPSMSMFYPDNISALYLSWALARSYGQMYLGSALKVDQSDWEKPLRIFESKHADVYSYPKKAADLAFYFSGDTRDYTRNGRKNAERMISRMQAAYLAGLQIDLVFSHESLETLCTMPCIAICDVEMLSDAEIETLRGYLRAGGRLLIEGKCGNLCADGRKRDYDVPADLSKYGDVCIVPEQPVLWIFELDVPKYEGNTSGTNMTADLTGKLKTIAASAILPYLKTRRVKVDTTAEVIASFHHNDSGYILHLFNSENLIPPEGTWLDHTWSYPNYEAGAAPIDTDITVTIQRCDDRKISSVTLDSPEFAAETELPFTDDGKTITFTVPANTFAGYALVVCA